MLDIIRQLNITSVHKDVEKGNLYILLKKI